MESIRLPEPMNSLIRDLEPKSVTNFFGGPGTGKTNLCLLSALGCIKNGGTVKYIDTEGGLSLERLKQLSVFSPIEKILEKIKILEPKDFSEQGKLVRSLGIDNTDLIIIDSMSALYRLEFAEQKQLKEINVSILEANRELSKQFSILSNIAREKNIPVIVTSHTFKNWDTGENEVVGGDAVKYWSKVIIFLEKTGRMSERRAILMKHRYLPEGNSVKYMIVNDGIRPSGFRIF